MTNKTKTFIDPPERDRDRERDREITLHIKQDTKSIIQTAGLKKQDTKSRTQKAGHKKQDTKSIILR